MTMRTNNIQGNTVMIIMVKRASMRKILETIFSEEQFDKWEKKRRKFSESVNRHMGLQRSDHWKIHVHDRRMTYRAREGSLLDGHDVLHVEVR